MRDAAAFALCLALGGGGWSPAPRPSPAQSPRNLSLRAASMGSGDGDGEPVKAKREARRAPLPPSSSSATAVWRALLSLDKAKRARDADSAQKAVDKMLQAGHRRAPTPNAVPFAASPHPPSARAPRSGRASSPPSAPADGLETHRPCWLG